MPTSLPPGPRLPPYLQSLAIIAAPLPFFRACRARYGELFTIRSFFNGRSVVVCDPALVKRVFTAPPGVLRAGQANAGILGPVLGEHSVLTLDGPEHLRQRRLLLPPFHGERMRTYERVMREATDAAVDRWPVGRAFPLLPEMQRVTLEIILKTVFGTRGGAREDALRDAIRELLTPTGSRARLLLFALTGGRTGDPVAMEAFRRRLGRVDHLLYEEIADRREHADLAEREDVCSLLLQARDEDGRPMTDVEVRDELMTLLVAGHETTATALAWAFERVLRSPAVRARVEAELEAGGSAEVDAVVRETLRIRNVIANVVRVVAEPFALGDHVLPAGIVVMPSITLTHRRRRSFPRPYEFRPERFADHEAGGSDAYSWIPFGGGTRRCLGASFALFEMRTVIETVLRRTRLEPSGRRAEPIRRSGITLVPGRGARVVQRRPPRPAAYAASGAAEVPGVPAPVASSTPSTAPGPARTRTLGRSG